MLFTKVLLTFRNSLTQFKKYMSSYTINREYREISVPTSYGQISGKAWGPKDGSRVLALHGWQDNCGTFDSLVPLLPKHLRIIAFDFPGHGLSSHKPPGASYHFLDQLADVKTVASHLEWDSFNIIGHSMGGATAMIYASCFPEDVISVVALDCMDTDCFSTYNYPTNTARRIKLYLDLQNKINKPPPLYSYESAHNRLQVGQKDFMTSKGVDYLIKRAVKPFGGDQNLFMFTRDLRVQAISLAPSEPKTWIEYLTNLQCNMLRIKAKDGVKSYRTDIKDFLKSHFEGKNVSLTDVLVEGLHHVHLEHPERVATHISQFLS